MHRMHVARVRVCAWRLREPLRLLLLVVQRGADATQRRLGVREL